MEAESLKLRHQTTILELTTGPGRRYTVEINPVDIQEVLDQADVPAKPAVAGYERVDAEEPRFSKKRVERPEGQPSYDAKLVEDFLAGTYCLHGGTGWWKYEFCYGKKVLQYHVVSHDVSQVISPII
jgi:endoplasmic reticulum lectin 1